MNPATVKRYLPWVVAVALFMEQLDTTIVNTAVPAMAESLQVTPLSLKAVVASYILSLAVCIPVSGWMADRYGTRRVFSIAVGLFTFSSVLCGLALNAPMLVAARILQGVGAAMMMPVGRLTIIRTFPKSELLRAMNFVIIPALIGPLLGPTVGGLIVHWVSWRYIFFVNVPMGLLALWLAHRHMPDYRGDAARPLDVVGLVLFGSGTALLSWLLEIFGEHRIDATSAAVLLLLCVSLLAAYVWHARETPHPLLRLRLFRVRTFRISVMGGFVTRLGVGGMPFLLPLLYQLGLGLPAWQSGLLMMPTAAAAMGMNHCPARAGALRLPAHPDREYGDDRLRHQPLLAGEPGHADRVDRAAGPVHGLLQFAAVHQHEFDGLRRHRYARFEHGQHDRELAAADVDELRAGVRFADRRLVSGRPAANRPRGGDDRAAPCLFDAGRADDPLVAVVLVAPPQGWRNRQPGIGARGGMSAVKTARLRDPPPTYRSTSCALIMFW